MTTPQLIDKRTALAELRRIRNKSSKPREFARVKRCIEDIFNRRKLSFEIERGIGLADAFLGRGLYGLVPDDERGAYDRLEKAFETLLHARGYREDIMTRQEHQLCGSTVWVGYGEHPYEPIGMIKERERLTVEEARRARQLEPVQSAFGSYFGSSERMVIVTREPLDDQGRTIRDPRVIDIRIFSELLRRGTPLETAFDSAVMPFVRNPDFPALRDAADV